MAVLRPSPFGILARRLFRELDEKNAAFDLPARRFVRGTDGIDCSVAIGTQIAAIPFGPAAGPHTQLAQNIVLSWLAGGRVLELKTVQQNDQLQIPRPCIDMREVGYNCEFSQELRVEQSLREYVKGALLVAMLAQSGKAGVLPGFQSTVFDASVGYDLAGIQSPKVDTYLRSLRDIRPIVDELLPELPSELRSYVPDIFPKALCNTVTLSTFHGCPPSEIEAITEHLMTVHQLDVVVKLNPTLLGRESLHQLLHERLGFTDVHVPDTAFAHDPTLDQALVMVSRLRQRAAVLGRRFGVKLTNTLVVENRRGYFPESVRESYLSGPPLHVLAMQLVQRFRATWGMDLHLSFSAGIDAHNMADALALGLAPVTVCTDWLKTGGYARGIRFHEALVERMQHVGATDLNSWTLRAMGHQERALTAVKVSSETRTAVLAAMRKGHDFKQILTESDISQWVAEAARLNTETYAASVADDPRYRRDHNEKSPRKVGSRLTVFDCLTCDKCIAVCPNNAVFAFVAPHVQVPILKVRNSNTGLVAVREGTLPVDERHQLATFADHCNDCGNCDVFCPEDGGPHIAKPRLFGSIEALREDPHGKGFFIERTSTGYQAHARHEGSETKVRFDNGVLRYEGDGFSLAFSPQDPTSTLAGSVTHEVDLTSALIVHLIATSVLSAREINPVTFLGGGL